ncbi:MAG TPA: hypothetical protein PLQ36_03645, partial [Candidatus Gracilibacteria bacterium]|nr:hypothetical protein [Candidatus Gracilibacteria bacterium]
QSAECIAKAQELMNNWLLVKDSASITQKMDIQEKLAIWCVRLGEIVSQLNYIYIYSYIARKYETSVRKNAIHKNGKTMSAAESLVDEELGHMRTQEIENEYLADRARNFLNQANKVLATMSQNISFSKQEFERTNN